jgi:hypothetical protein
MAHHAALRAFFDDRALRKEKFTAWDEVPPFRYVEESISDVLARIAPALAVFVSVALAFGLWAWWTLHRRPLDA